jgi:aspartyl protease family protein
MIIFAWVFAFLLFALFFHFSGEERGRSEYSVKHGTLTIEPDASGHYWIEGMIHQTPVHFMVDTGASLVAIPQSLAEKLQIKGQYPIQLNTAGGVVRGELVRLRQLSFAGFQFNNVKAVIMPQATDSTILLGMNILSKFTITQKDRQLLLKR